MYTYLTHSKRGLDFRLPNWATLPIRLGLSERNSGKIPERPRKRSQSVSWNSPREYGWDALSPVIQGICGFQSISRILSPPVRLGVPLFQQWFRRGPLRAGPGIPSSTEGISDQCHVNDTLSFLHLRMEGEKEPSLVVQLRLLRAQFRLNCNETVRKISPKRICYVVFRRAHEHM